MRGCDGMHFVSRRVGRGSREIEINRKAPQSRRARVGPLRRGRASKIAKESKGRGFQTEGARPDVIGRRVEPLVAMMDA